jgi:hypothetical protein
LPAKVLEDFDFKGNIIIEIIDNEGILLKPQKSKARENWEEHFKRMHKNKVLIKDTIDLNLLEELEC